jgi:transcriptional regulator with XRE-family HTH domain
VARGSDLRYEQFLKRLREARRRSGLTQAAAATQLDEPQSFLSKRETGEQQVDVFELAVMAGWRECVGVEPTQDCDAAPLRF